MSENWEKQLRARPHFSLGELGFFVLNVYAEVKTLGTAKNYIARARKSGELATYKKPGSKRARVTQQEAARFLGVKL